MWFLFAVISAFCQATTQALAKKYQVKNNYIVLASVSYSICAVILFIASFIKGIPTLGPNFWKAVMMSGSLCVLGAIFFYKSLRLTDLSLASPMLALTPVFLTLSGYLVLGEKPTPVGFIGILSVVFGIFFINSPKASKFFHAIHSIKNDKGILLMLLVAFIWSIGAAFDKVVVLNSDFILGSACITLFSSVFFTFYALIKFRTKATSLYKKAFMGGFLLAVISALSSVTTSFAYLYTLVAYVISVKRLSILFGVLIGIFIFKEPEMKKRLIGAIIAVVGIVLIVFA
jgi:drug/metabolite transporter (DMT)-like permease